MNPLVQSFVDSYPESTIKALHSQAGFTDYAACLLPLWNGQNGKAIDAASAVISANPDHPMRFQVYRMWIEALANSGEKLALHALQEHLLMRGEAAPEDRVTYMALRGLIHMELDRTHAARLMLRAISGETGNPWAMELNEAVLNRDINPVELPALIQMNKPFADYVVWQNLVRTFVGMNQRHRAEPCLDIIDRLFTGNPLRDVCYFHWTSELADWASALEHATHLASTFQDHPDYGFFAAHAAYKMNRFNQAVVTLEASKGLNLETDPDASLLHGQALKQIGMQKHDAGILERATKSLSRASKLLSREGVSPMVPEMLIREIKEALDDVNDANGAVTETASLFRPTGAWLVKLSARRYQELRTSRESSIERLVRPLGPDARPGDLCFFAIDESGNTADRTWKIAAIYTVDSDPVWHPYWRHQSALQLIHLPKKLISVDVKMVDAPVAPKGMDVAPATKAPKAAKTSKASRLPKDHPLRFGVYQLEEGALDLIQEAIKQHQQGEAQDSRDQKRNQTGHKAV
ncbi:hypothetical protein EBZ80_07780 [bacterium]|nr:hypothetical protein [bacterium]